MSDLGFLAGLFGHTIKWVGALLPQRSFLNFTGGLKAQDNPSTNSTDVTFDGDVPITATTLTEPGDDPASSGWIRFVSDSLGLFGGFSGGEAQVLRWLGASKAIEVGDAVDADTVLVQSAVSYTCDVAGFARFMANGTNSVIAGPDGSSVKVTLTDTTATLAAATSFTLKVGTSLRFGGDATSAVMFSPGAVNHLDIDDSAVAVHGKLTADGVFDLLTPITTPAAPASGFRFFVDVVDGKLKVISSGSTVTPLANP